MTCLKQLCLAKKSHQTGRYPPKKSSLWPGVENFKEIAHRYALLIHSKCPSLEYIMIGFFAWHFITDTQTAIPNASVRVREMKQDETLSFEFFGIETFPTQAGLSGKEKVHRELSEAEWDFSEKMAADFDTAYQLGTLDQVAAQWIHDNPPPAILFGHETGSQAPGGAEV